MWNEKPLRSAQKVTGMGCRRMMFIRIPLLANSTFRIPHSQFKNLLYRIDVSEISIRRKMALNPDLKLEAIAPVASGLQPIA